MRAQSEKFASNLVPVYKKFKNMMLELFMPNTRK